MPANRMIFMDTWYVPIEEHIPRAELESLFGRHQLSFQKLSSQVDTDLDYVSPEAFQEPKSFGARGSIVTCQRLDVSSFRNEVTAS